jgi:hypothetical protein
MKNSPPLDIRSLATEDLLSGISPSARPEPSVVDKWLASADIYPGTTRIRACDLYREFHIWYTKLPDYKQLPPVPGIRLWGKLMVGKFKTGRGNQGIFYYISRESVCEIPPSLAKVGPGNPGGSTPGGSKG